MSSPTANSASGFDAHFGLRFKLWGNFDLRASRSSTASVFTFGLWRVLRGSLRFGGCHQHRLAGAAPAPLAGAGNGRGGSCLNRARTGNLQQPPCPGSSAVNESCYTLVYCSYSNADFRRQQVLQLAIGLVLFRVNQTIITIFTPILHYYYLLWQ